MWGWWNQLKLFQLTHLLRGATHASCPRRFLQCHFNSRTSCEVRLTGGNCFCRRHKFQLTHLLRGATRSLRKKPIASPNFNSRTSCEVRQKYRVVAAQRVDFNSRTSCEVRQSRVSFWIGVPVFQLTHLLRGATFRVRSTDSRSSISTHAPLARCDKSVPRQTCHHPDFNSRTSCEVRRGGNENGNGL